MRTREDRAGADRMARNLDRAMEALSRRLLEAANDADQTAAAGRELAELVKTLRQAAELRQALGGGANGVCTVVMEPEVRACAE